LFLTIVLVDGQSTCNVKSRAVIWILGLRVGDPFGNIIVRSAWIYF
jgi:hypothetical protein